MAKTANIMRAIVSIALAVAIAGCGDHRGPGYPPTPKPAPFTVTMNTVSSTFTNGVDVPLMRLSIRNTTTLATSLNRIHANLAASNTSLRCQYDLYVDGRRVSSAPVALAPNTPFDLYFAFGGDVQPSQTIDVMVKANISGMKNGDELVLTEDMVDTHNDGDDHFVRSSNAVRYVNQALLLNNPMH